MKTGEVSPGCWPKVAAAALLVFVLVAAGAGLSIAAVVL